LSWGEHTRTHTTQECGGEQQILDGKRQHQGADHGHAEQDIDFLLQAFFTMLFAIPIKFGRQLKNDLIVKNKAIASVRISSPVRLAMFCLTPTAPFGKRLKFLQTLRKKAPARRRVFF
jgi:hypothetical protein